MIQKQLFIFLLCCIMLLCILFTFVFQQAEVSSKSNHHHHSLDNFPHSQSIFQAKQSYIIIFLRGSGSTWLSAVINNLEPRLFRNFNEPQQPVIDEIEAGIHHTDSIAFVGSKSKIQQLSAEQRQKIANGTYDGKVIFLHRTDTFKHSISIVRKKTSAIQNANVYKEQDKTPTQDIDLHMFKVQAAELRDQREDFLRLMIERASNGFESYSLSYERLQSNFESELKQLLHFIARDVDRNILNRFKSNAIKNAMQNKKLPLKNTNNHLNKSVTNLLDIARIVKKDFPFILPSVPRDLLDRLANERLEEKNATLEHKKEREQMYDELNAKQAEKIFQTCSRPPQRKQRPLFHCQVKDFLIASGGEASPNEFKDYFGKMVTKNPSICLAFAMGLDMVSRYNSTTDMFQLKEHLRW